NGSTFAVVYRREQISRNNLYFRSVSIDGTTGPTEQVITTANSFVHFHPTIVYLGETTYDAGAGAVLSPYAVLYSEDGRAKIVRLRDNGGPLATTDLTSVSSGALPGDFASAITVSEFDGIVVAA